MDPDYKAMVRSESFINGLDENLMLAICDTESSFRPWVMKFEPAWQNFYKPDEVSRILGIDKPTEIQLQMFSYGLMQVMGGTARGLGYLDYLPKLLDPQASIHYGCLLMRQLKKRFTQATEADLISAYNYGHPANLSDGTYRNQIYVSKVQGNLKKYRV